MNSHIAVDRIWSDRKNSSSVDWFKWFFYLLNAEKDDEAVDETRQDDRERERERERRGRCVCNILSPLFPPFHLSSLWHQPTFKPTFFKVVDKRRRRRRKKERNRSKCCCCCCRCNDDDWVWRNVVVGSRKRGDAYEVGYYLIGREAVWDRCSHCNMIMSRCTYVLDLSSGNTTWVSL